MTRSICINHGCNKLVTFSRTNMDGTKRWRIHCDHCQKASYGKWPHRKGVTPYKTGKCSNHDMHLGFKCATDFTKVHPDAKGITEVDHKNGDHCDNSPENLEELCKYCHSFKGQRAGDFDNTRRK
jgi:hypothetical protein